MRYRYRIHEELYHKEKKYLGMINAEDQLMILHTGYNESIEKDLEKSKRNIQLLEQNLEENPKNAMCIMYLGDAYGMGGRVADSLNCYRRVVNDPDLEITDEYAVFRSGIQVLKLLSKAPEYGTEKEFFEISSKLRDRGHDLHPDVDYYEGCWHWKNQELETTAIYFEHALKKLEQYKGGDTIQLSAELEMVNCIIASAALKQGNLQKAVQFAVTTLRLNKYSAEALRTLLNAFSREYQAGTDVEVYWTFLCKIYDINNLKDLIFIHRIAGDTDFAAIQECVLRIVPSEIGNQILSES